MIDENLAPFYNVSTAYEARESVSDSDSRWRSILGERNTSNRLQKPGNIRHHFLQNDNEKDSSVPSLDDAFLMGQIIRAFWDDDVDELKKFERREIPRTLWSENSFLRQESRVYINISSNSKTKILAEPYEEYFEDDWVECCEGSKCTAPILRKSSAANATFNVKKSVRFMDVSDLSLDSVDERPFTPLFTSTPLEKKDKFSFANYSDSFLGVSSIVDNSLQVLENQREMALSLAMNNNRAKIYYRLEFGDDSPNKRGFGSTLCECNQPSQAKEEHEQSLGRSIHRASLNANPSASSTVSSIKINGCFRSTLCECCQPSQAKEKPIDSLEGSAIKGSLNFNLSSSSAASSISMESFDEGNLCTMVVATEELDSPESSQVEFDTLPRATNLLSACLEEPSECE